jgi:pantoate--beta-alanine ligase
VKVLKEIQALQMISDYHRATFKTIGLVPTMGFLHEGHLALLEKAKQECDIVVVSIFVNPAQFLPHEDLDKYPRDFLRDYHLCNSSGVNYIFYPEPELMYPKDYFTFVNVEDITERLEGQFRPGHFKGVSTIVNKLINIVKPHKAYFGQKDAQQAVIIQKMVEDLNIDTEVIICNTIREENGLAKSSRNVYLSEEEKQEAAVIFEALTEGKKMITDYKITDTESVKNVVSNYINRKSDKIKLQYLSITDNVKMKELGNLKLYKGDIIISLAAYMGNTRLIDNVSFNYKYQ